MVVSSQLGHLQGALDPDGEFASMYLVDVNFVDMELYTDLSFSYNLRVSPFLTCKKNCKGSRYKFGALPRVKFNG